MARKPSSNWSEDKSPEEIADAVARWIAEGASGQSPVQQLEEAAAGSADADDAELSEELLKWLSEGTAPANVPRPVDIDQSDGILDESLPDEPAGNAEGEYSGGTNKEDASPQDVISLPTLPEGEAAPPPPPPPSFLTDETPENAETSGAEIPDAGIAGDADSEAASDDAPSENRDSEAAVGAESVVETEKPDPDVPEISPSGEEVVDATKPGQSSQTPMMPRLSDPGDDAEPEDTRREPFLEMRPPDDSLDEKGVENPDASTAGDDNKDTIPGDGEGSRPTLDLTEDQEFEAADEAPAGQGGDEIPTNIVALEAARQNNQGIPPDLQAIATSPETEELAALQAERLARPVAGPPPKSNWSRRFSFMVLLGLILGLGALAYFTFDLLSKPPEPPVASRIKPPVKTAEPPKADPVPAQPAEPAEQATVPSPPPQDPVAAVFDRPPPAVDAPAQLPTSAPDPEPPPPATAKEPSDSSPPAEGGVLPPVPAENSAVNEPPEKPLMPEPSPAAPTPGAVIQDPPPAAQSSNSVAGEPPPATSAPVPPPATEAAKPPEPAVQAPAPKPVIGKYAAQLGAVRDPAVAEREQKRLTARLKDLLDGKEVLIVPAAIKDRGTYYRLRILGFETRAAAGSFCTKAKLKQISCVPVRS